jgi:hypothetical protein
MFAFPKLKMTLLTPNCNGMLKIVSINYLMTESTRKPIRMKKILKIKHFYTLSANIIRVKLFENPFKVTGMASKIVKFSSN